MPVDYSKWDALELSDDSDIEVHPNVDKKSFIRAKQNQIHQQRAQRKHQISTLKFERIINDGLLLRIDRLVTVLKSHKADTAANPDQLVFQALIESAGDPAEDVPPPPPEGVHANVQEETRYSKMMAGLVDQVKKEVDESKTGDRLEGFITGVQGHRAKVEGLQKELAVKLAELEKEDSRYITSENIHTGFNYSNVKKGAEAAGSTASTSGSTIELLNPGSARPLPSRTDTGQSEGADADIEDGPDPDEMVGADDDDDTPRASKLGKQFAKIPTGDYSASLDFISKYPGVLHERETDGLLVEAFEAQEQGKEKYARQCVHQALLIQYCRQLGRDGVRLFFQRITTKDHKAQKLFVDDVNSTYAKIRERVAALAEQRDAEGGGDVEQIQLHAVDPGTTINIVVPPPIPADIDLNAPGAEPPSPELAEQVAARRIFESFPPGLQRALETGKLDEVNRVLGKMSVSEAEEVVEKLSEGGMLNLESGVVDATTEEGKRVVEEIERTGRLPGSMGGEQDVGLSDEPAMEVD